MVSLLLCLEQLIMGMHSMVTICGSGDNKRVLYICMHIFCLNNKVKVILCANQLMMAAFLEREQVQIKPLELGTMHNYP